MIVSTVSNGNAQVFLDPPGDEANGAQRQPPAQTRRGPVGGATEHSRFSRSSDGRAPDGGALAASNRMPAVSPSSTGSAGGSSTAGSPGALAIPAFHDGASAVSIPTSIPATGASQGASATTRERRQTLSGSFRCRQRHMARVRPGESGSPIVACRTDWRRLACPQRRGTKGRRTGVEAGVAGPVQGEPSCCAPAREKGSWSAKTRALFSGS